MWWWCLLVCVRVIRWWFIWMIVWLMVSECVWLNFELRVGELVCLV